MKAAVMAWNHLVERKIYDFYKIRVSLCPAIQLMAQSDDAQLEIYMRLATYVSAEVGWEGKDGLFCSTVSL